MIDKAKVLKNFERVGVPRIQNALNPMGRDPVARRMLWIRASYEARSSSGDIEYGGVQVLTMPGSFMAALHDLFG